MDERLRNVLDDCTNTDVPETPTHRHHGKRVASCLPTPPATRKRVDRGTKRRTCTDNNASAKKRVKLVKGKIEDDPFLDSDSSSGDSSEYESTSEDEGGMSALEAQRSARAREVNARFLRMRACINPLEAFKCLSVSKRPILASFVSSHKSDVFKCQSLNGHTYLTPPYACAYTHDAKMGGRPLLAVATEQGAVHILDTTKRKDWDVEPPRTTFHLHENGIFDVKWNISDTLLATSSADHSTRITCAETQKTTHILRGHTSTVKCIAWDPAHHDLLATGGRDGSICLWDLRVCNRGEMNDEGDAQITRDPVTLIKGAHEAAHINGGRLNTRKGKKNPLPRTVTSLLYPETVPYSLVSGGAFDGILRCWDLRQPTSKRAKTTKVKVPTCLYSTVQDPTTRSGSRARGIVSLAAGHGPTAGVIFGLAADSQVYTYTLPRLDAQENVVYGHDHLQSSSFYASLSVSPCGQWLASGGGTGVKGSAFLFDVADAARPWREQKDRLRGVELRGQEGEVGAVDWTENGVATCADDGTVRIWRPGLEVHQGCVADAEESRWEWAWAK
ncbi:WD40 repeat-like protein [Amanita muscaria]